MVSSRFQEASVDGKVELRNANILKNRDGEMVIMGRSVEIIINDENGVERASHKLTYGSKIMVKDGDTVARGDKLYEWDPLHAADHC